MVTKSTANMLDVFHIKPPRHEGGKSYWTKIGIAFENADKSLNVILDHIPLDGKLHIRKQRHDKNEASDENTGEGSTPSIF